MFYFLLFHSSITKSKDIDKKILITVLYGSILYIIFHAITSSSTKSFLVTIKKYFFLIFTLDVICMIYVLKNFLPQINVKDKVNNMQNMLSQINLFGLIDTSFYDNNNEIKIDNINLSNIEEFEKLNKLNDLLQNGNNTINTNNNINTNTNNNTNPSSILKKNVSIREDKNEINEIENIKHQEFQNQEFQNQEFQNQEFQNQQLQNQQLQNQEFQNQEIQNQQVQNQELQNSDSNNNLNNELQNLDKLHTLTKNNLNSNNTNNKNNTFNNSMNVQNLPQIGAINMETPISKIRNQNKNNNNITQTSINKIRQKQKQNNQSNTLHKEIEENIMKKDTINNEELNKLNLNYSPNEIFKDIKYNTKKSNDLLNNKNLNNKNINQSNFDNQSLVSNSDIGSVLDLDMDEFENNLDF